MKRVISLVLALALCFSVSATIGCGEHTHTWGEWVSNNNETHTRTCTEDASHTQTENCTLELLFGGGIATHECTVCGYVKYEGDDEYQYIEPGIYNKPEANRTEIKVMNHHGGIGSVWLDQAAERYAKKMQKESYAPGKQGVYININKRMGVSGAMAQANLQTDHIFFGEGKITAGTWGESGLLMNMDEIVKDTTREGGSLDSLIFESNKATLQGTTNGNTHYYALPHYEYYGGSSYNREIFDEYGAYFADEQCNPEYLNPYANKFGFANFIIPNFLNEDDAIKSPGPDGLYDTEDDGLPASFEQYIILCDFFKVACEISPIVISGACASSYLNFYLTGLWAALAGKEQMQAYYSMNGKIEVVTGYYNEPIMEGVDYILKPKTEWVEINYLNGYLGNDMVAKYYAFAATEIMFKEGYFAPESIDTEISHLNAQSVLIYGGKATKSPYSKSAMLMEATYWYNESEENLCFDNYITLTGDVHEIDLRQMALPTAYTTEEYENRVSQEEYDNLSQADRVGKQVHRASALIDLGQGACVINNNIKDNEEIRTAVIDFVKYLYSENELKYFTMETGMARAIKYELSENQQSSMGIYYEKLWQLRDWQKGSNVVYCAPAVGASQQTLNTFKKAKPTIQLVLSCPSLVIDTSTSAFSHLKDTSLNPDGTYLKGTQYCFENSRLLADSWNGFI